MLPSALRTFLQFLVRQLIVKSYKLTLKQVFKQCTGYLGTLHIVNQLHHFKFSSFEKRLFVVVTIYIFRNPAVNTDHFPTHH